LQQVGAWVKVPKIKLVPVSFLYAGDVRILKVTGIMADFAAGDNIKGQHLTESIHG